MCAFMNRVSQGTVFVLKKFSSKIFSDLLVIHPCAYGVAKKKMKIMNEYMYIIHFHVHMPSKYFSQIDLTPTMECKKYKYYIFPIFRRLESIYQSWKRLKFAWRLFSNRNHCRHNILWSTKWQICLSSLFNLSVLIMSPLII